MELSWTCCACSARLQCFESLGPPPPPLPHRCASTAAASGTTAALRLWQMRRARRASPSELGSPMAAPPLPAASSSSSSSSTAPATHPLPSSSSSSPHAKRGPPDAAPVFSVSWARAAGRQRWGLTFPTCGSRRAAFPWRPHVPKLFSALPTICSLNYSARSQREGGHKD